MGCAMREGESSAMLSTEAERPTENAGSSSPSLACQPQVAGLTPAAIEPITIECPGNYAPRLNGLKAAIPIVGRFTNEAELIDAFCVAKTSPSPTQAQTIRDGNSGSIDFESSVVVSFAYDTNDGSPRLYRRGDELWLTVTHDECKTDPAQLASIAFVIPKSSVVKEQACSIACR